MPTSRLSRSILIGLIALAASLPALAQWSVRTRVDSMTDETLKAAVVTNSDGHSLSVYRGPENAAWATFSLSDRSLDQIAHDRAPIYRIDKNEADDLEGSRSISPSLGVKMYVWQPKFINFKIWHGREEEGRGKTVKELMTGKSVVFRYTLPTGGYKETTFTLNGAGPAIASALGIRQAHDANAEAAAAAFRDASIEGTTACQRDMSTFRKCLEEFNACRRDAGTSAEAVRRCIKQ